MQALLNKKHAADDRVTPVLNDAASLIVVAGLGRATGSFIGPSLVKASMDAGIPTLGIWIRPFRFENTFFNFYTRLVDQGIPFRSACHIACNDDAWSAIGGESIPFVQAFDSMNMWVAEKLVMANVTSEVPIA